MKKELLLLRHGKSDWSVDVSDFDRPLKNRGKRGAQRMGVWLLEQNLIPDYIISSPAERASNTAAKLAKAMGISSRSIHYDQRIYEAGVDNLKQVLADSPSYARRVLLVGHNPGLEDLLHDLQDGTAPVSADGKLLATATLAVLQMPENWKNLKPGSARLISVTRAASLADKFPFNGLSGPEFRSRPAYYYSQSAAIPYRIHENKLEILIISSSGNKHWGIPKGIIDPGSTPHESAAMEAHEEAGVSGTISQQMLGSYTCDKWGATCTVLVFPLAVEQMSDDEQWRESHRERQWVSVKQACDKLKQQALKPILLNFSDLCKEKQLVCRG